MWFTETVGNKVARVTPQGVGPPGPTTTVPAPAGAPRPAVEAGPPTIDRRDEPPAPALPSVTLEQGQPGTPFGPSARFLLGVRASSLDAAGNRAVGAPQAGSVSRGARIAASCAAGCVKPRSSVTIYLTPRTRVAVVRADARGAFVAVGAVPATVAAGRRAIVAAGRAPDGKAVFYAAGAGVVDAASVTRRAPVVCPPTGASQSLARRCAEQQHAARRHYRGFPFNGVTLGVGTSGLDVTLLQRTFGRPATGPYDDALRLVVATFQRGHRLRATGSVDRATWAVLFPGR